MRIEELKSRCSGKWIGIILALGIEIRTDGKHSSCPICGPGNNGHRFRFDDKAGTGSWICTHCGAGDSIALVCKSLNIPFSEAMDKIKGVMGMAEEKVIPEAPRVDPKIALTAVGKKSQRLSGDDFIMQYLRSRGIVMWPNNLRKTEQCWNSDVKKEMRAMLAVFSNQYGKPISWHRTYLDGIKKADVPKVRKMMTATEQLNGGAIRLAEPKNGCIGVAEGIETALSAWQLFEIPTWSAYSAALMEAFIPPEGVTKVVIFSDHDDSGSYFAGQRAAYALGNKLLRAPYKLIVEVQIPDFVGDWNDVLIKMQK